ncbi:MAG: S53 family peptidase, partial [Isosphaeraceae bacterium]
HTAAGTATGVGGVNLVGDLNLSGTTHTNAGTYTDTWTFTDTTGNYSNTSGTVKDSIAKANATIVVTPYSVTYDGKSHTATGTATGVGGVNLVGDLNLSGTTHTNAGTYTDTWTFTDAIGNYNNASGTVTDIISNAVSLAGSIFVLDQTAGGALTLAGNASINVPGGVYVDSSSSSALSASGNAAVKAEVIDVHGGVQKSGNASFNPAPVTGAAAVADPLAGLTVPTYSGTPISEILSGNSTATINPGVYSQITVSCNASLTMNAGVYIIEGGGFAVSCNARIKGSGVTIYNTSNSKGCYGSITLSGNGSLSAPTTGTYAGLLIFQDRNNPRALTLSGNVAQGMAGTIYAQKAQLVESGNAQVGSTSNPVSIVVDTLTLSCNAVANSLSLNAPTGTVAYTPAQIRAAYGINNLSLDGTGQTIAIVAAYDDPSIYLALDAFDSQFGLTPTGPTLYQQYGASSSFLRVLNQNGQSTSLPATDPSGAGTDNWEVEEALDVEWAHAIAPGAQIVLVEANGQSLSDLMAGVATAASQPGVSVVSMSWGFPEGQAVFASDEAAYDGVFNVPGVTFVASTGDYGAADPEYPAYSPNVVAVGGTSLTLNADGSYHSEAGWGYYSDSVGALIGSGGGISLYEPEPAYQEKVQTTGGRTTPDVSLVADPATGAWIADPYNLPATNPFEIVGGTSLSAPCWAGLVALANQGRAAAGEPTLNSSSPTETQQALYSLPQRDYNVISSGNNGYSAASGYNLVTGLGTPVANLLVNDLVAYHGPGTSYSGPTVGPLQNTTLTNTGAGSGGKMDVSMSSVFDSFTVTSTGAGYAHDRSPSTHTNSPKYKPLAPDVTNRTVTTQDPNIPDPGTGAEGPHAGVPFSNRAAQLALAQGAASGLTGNNGAVAVLDEVLSGWAQADSGSSNGIAHRVLGQGTNPAVRPLLSPQSTQSGRLVNNPQAVDVLLERGAIIRSLFADSTLPIQKKLFGSSIA